VSRSDEQHPPEATEPDAEPDAEPDDSVWEVTDHQGTDGERLRKARAPQTLGSAVDAFVAQHGWAVRLRGARLFDRWEEVVGPELAKRCEPVRVAGGTLTVRAENQTWATQIRYMTTRLRDQAAAVIGEDLVKEVRIIVGPLEGTASDP
jgi:predicted nucleic acid-binding Zn ribbon protein